MKPIDVFNHPTLFGPIFEGPSWDPWRVAIKAITGSKMTAAELELFRGYTGRQAPPGKPVREAWFAVGRRGGKSRVAAFFALLFAAFRDYGDALAPGERTTVMLLASDRKQARVLMGYVRSLIKEIPALSQMVVNERAESIDLNNGVTLEIHTSSYRTVRGYTVAAAILDEIAFWRSDESANPDTEIVSALRPAMAKVPGSLLLGISSPYARRGVLWQAYRDHFSKDADPVLVWNAPSLVMNPTIPAHVVEDAYAEDPISAASEWGGEFRKDIETFVSRESVEQCVVEGRHELPPVAGVRYSAFVDPSGGSSDSMTLCIGHRQDGTVVVDALREWRAAFDPESAVEEFCALLKQYRVDRVSGDRYAGEWPRQAFRKRNVEYKVAEQTKNELYIGLLPLINSQRIELLDHGKTLAQLCSLERRTARSGRDSIDHAPGGHDDLVNSVAGAACELGYRPQTFSEWGPFEGPWVGSDGKIRSKAGVIGEWDPTSPDAGQVLDFFRETARRGRPS
jgi:hypothetical protein